MTFGVRREYNDQQVTIPIRTRGKERIVVKAYNPKKANTVYFDIAPVINGTDKIVMKIPRMPEMVVVEIYNEKVGNTDADVSFQIQKPKIGPIVQGFVIRKIMDPNVDRFARFLDWFAENAAILSAQNSIYVSNDGKFRIDYVDVIRDDNGTELRTPLRVNSKTKVMQIAKKYYIGYTVPGRKMWGWHEFAHVWINVNPSDELEADKNAIKIYLGYGNPIAEAYNVVLKVFKNTPSDLNKQRYEALNNYIRNFNREAVKQVS